MAMDSQIMRRLKHAVEVFRQSKYGSMAAENGPPHAPLVHDVMMRSSASLRACPVDGGGFLLVVEDGYSDHAVGKLVERWVRYCKDEAALAEQIAAYFARKKMGVPTGSPVGYQSVDTYYDSAKQGPQVAAGTRVIR